MLLRLVLVMAATACATAGRPEATGGDDVGGVDAQPVDAADCAMQTFYRDGDHDGHGDRTHPVMACARPADAVANDDDCDDSSDQVFPGNRELCDGIDNDCSPFTQDV